YVFLQLLMAARYRGRWRIAALAPLLVMVPLGSHAWLAYRAGSPAWPVLLVLASPAAFVYLVMVGVAKAAAASRAAKKGPWRPWQPTRGSLLGCAVPSYCNHAVAALFQRFESAGILAPRGISQG